MKKLSLNKKVIAVLNTKEAAQIIGGSAPNNCSGQCPSVDNYGGCLLTSNGPEGQFECQTDTGGTGNTGTVSQGCPSATCGTTGGTGSGAPSCESLAGTNAGLCNP